MPIFNSRQAGIIFVQDRALSFYNDTIPSGDTTFYFYNDDFSGTEVYSLDVSASADKFRCLQYKTFNTYQYSQMRCPFVLYLDSSNGCSPLFQANFAQCQEKDGNIMCTFWSTLISSKSVLQTGTTSGSYSQYGKTIKQNNTVKYMKYDPACIRKANVQDLSSIDLQDESYNNILCVAQITIKTMYVASSTNQDRIAQDVAIIQNIPIVLQQAKSTAPVFDFSVQGGTGGGGVKQHNHIPHIDGTSFAFSVFHPGTAMPQLPWSSV